MLLLRPWSSRAFALGLATLAPASLFAPSSHASDPSEASQLVASGIERFRQQDYEGARVAFRRAYQLDPQAVTLMDLALAELQSGHAVDAVQHLRIYLKDPGAQPDKLEAVRTKWLPRAESQTARLAVDAPSGAELLVDGVSHGRLPLRDPVDVSAGDHDVLVLLGSWSHAWHVSARAGQEVRILVERPAEPAPSAPSAASAASAAPRATATSTSKPPARREVVTTREPSRAKIVTFIVLGTVALVSVGAGAVYTMSSNSKADEASNLRSGLAPNGCAAMPPAAVCPRLAQVVDDQYQDHDFATGFFVAGGVLAAGAVATWFLWPKQEATASRTSGAWSLRPTVGVRSAAVAVEGVF